MHISVSAATNPPATMAAALTPCSSSSSLSTLRKQPLLPPPSLSSPNLPQFPKPLTPSLKTLTTNPHQISPLRSSLSPLSSPLPAPPPTLKSRLRDGETLYGIFLLSFSPTLAEIAALAGYDYAVVDMEHGHGGISAALPVLHALAAANTAAIIRLPESSATWAKKALDLGPQGIMFPMISNRKEAKKAVSYCRFPPAGCRGSAHTVIRASNYGISEGYLTNYEEELLIMCQVECTDGVKNIKEISAVDGVDCIQMGPLDLSASLGYLWDPGNRKVREVLRGAEKGVLGTPAGDTGSTYLAGFAMPHDKPEDMRRRGYHMVAGTVDLGLFRAAAVEDVRRFKAETGGDEVVEDKSGDSDEKYWSE